MYVWIWTCILWYVLVLVLELWNMYSSISVSCSMCIVLFARVGVKTFMILYEPFWSCMILHDPLCVYRILCICCIHVRACYIYICVPVISCYSGTRRTPFWLPSAMKPLTAWRTCRIWWPIPCRMGHLNKSLSSSTYICIICISYIIFYD